MASTTPVLVTRRQRAHNRTVGARIAAEMDALIESGLTLEQAARKMADEHTARYVTSLDERASRKRNASKRYR